MGLDITLGVLVLIAAIRGWFRGFLRQSIPLGALVACVYLADPVRDLARPYARKGFPSIGPEVRERLLWWVAATVCYFAIAGIGLSLLKSMRKRTYGDPEPNRTDQGAGFTLGALKGAIAASFLAWGLGEFGPNMAAPAPFLAEQARESRAMKFSEQYRPARTLWYSVPVQSFVARVRTRGVNGAPPKARPEGPAPEVEAQTARPAPPPDPVKTASKAPRTLSLPRLDPEAPDFERLLEEAMKREGLSRDWR